MFSYLNNFVEGPFKQASHDVDIDSEHSVRHPLDVSVAKLGYGMTNLKSSFPYLSTIAIGTLKIAYVFALDFFVEVDEGEREGDVEGVEFVGPAPTLARLESNHKVNIARGPFRPVDRL